MRWHVHPKRRLYFNGIHGFISQKIELFITTAVRTSVSYITNASFHNIYSIHLVLRLMQKLPVLLMRKIILIYLLHMSPIQVFIRDFKVKHQSHPPIKIDHLVSDIFILQGKGSGLNVPGVHQYSRGTRPELNSRIRSLSLINRFAYVYLLNEMSIIISLFTIFSLALT
jgi:hypothetical protein